MINESWYYRLGLTIVLLQNSLVKTRIERFSTPNTKKKKETWYGKLSLSIYIPKCLSIKNLYRIFESFDNYVYLFTNRSFILWEPTLLTWDKSECVLILHKPGQITFYYFNKRAPLYQANKMFQGKEVFRNKLFESKNISLLSQDLVSVFNQTLAEFHKINVVLIYSTYMHFFFGLLHTIYHQGEDTLIISSLELSPESQIFIFKCVFGHFLPGDYLSTENQQVKSERTLLPLYFISWYMSLSWATCHLSIGYPNLYLYPRPVSPELLSCNFKYLLIFHRIHNFPYIFSLSTDTIMYQLSKSSIWKLF